MVRVSLSFFWIDRDKRLNIFNSIGEKHIIHLMGLPVVFFSVLHQKQLKQEILTVYYSNFSWVHLQTG